MKYVLHAVDNEGRVGGFCDVDDTFYPQQIGAPIGDQDVEGEPKYCRAYRIVEDQAKSSHISAVPVDVMGVIMVMAVTVRSVRVVGIGLEGFGVEPFLNVERLGCRVEERRIE